jgi:hypothetical protein
MMLIASSMMLIASIMQATFERQKKSQDRHEAIDLTAEFR